MESKHYLVGIFDDEDVLLHAVEQIREKGVRIEEVYSPFPVHGLDEVLGYRRSRLPIAAFMFGLTGTSLALIMQIWMLGYDWPMIIGGKKFDDGCFPDSYRDRVVVGLQSERRPHRPGVCTQHVSFGCL